MKQIVLSGLVLMAALAAPAPAQDAAPLPGAAPVLTVLTREDPQTQLMALILTRASAQQGVPVRVLLCDKAGDLALAQPPEAATRPLAPRNMSPHGLLENLIDDGVTVQVCAIYLPNSPHTAEDLHSEIGVATPPEIATIMADPRTRFFTF
jgi:hypothetical protein